MRKIGIQGLMIAALNTSVIRDDKFVRRSRASHTVSEVIGLKAGQAKAVSNTVSASYVCRG
tara:strand:- start:7104 stop:7286 length:183 start_codon:yes stop_codon:yes gene_type:complete